MADQPALDILEIIARTNREQATTLQLASQTKWKPWEVVISAATATAALIGAGVALGAIIFHH